MFVCKIYREIWFLLLALSLTGHMILRKTYIFSILNKSVWLILLASLIVVGLKCEEAVQVSRDTFLTDSVSSKVPKAESHWDLTSTLGHANRLCWQLLKAKDWGRAQQGGVLWWGLLLTDWAFFSHSWWRQRAPQVWKNSREPPRKLHLYPLEFKTIYLHLKKYL